jgi:hypothetical protein
VSVARRSADLVVVSALEDWVCAGCGCADEDLLTMDDRGPLCMSCADLAHLVFLPRGDTALTRRARKHSHLSAVVVRFSRARKRYERQGVLVEETAIAQAEAECLADEDARSRRRERETERRANEDVGFQRDLASAIARLFPNARTRDSRRSRGTPPSEAVAALAARPPAERSTRRRSPWPLSRPCVTATPTTTIC